jgi:uncharacterized membrane protein (DUF485 family)
MDTDDIAALELQQILSIITYIVFSIPFAIGNGYLASRLGRNVAAWVVLTLVPVINTVFMIYVIYIALYALFDRLKEINERLPRPAEQQSGEHRPS